LRPGTSLHPGEYMGCEYRTRAARQAQKKRLATRAFLTSDAIPKPLEDSEKGR
jgi:hypothetical protein